MMLFVVQFPVAELEPSRDRVWADELPKERKDRARASYLCIGCGGDVVFRAGTKRPHFAHKDRSACSGETALHQLAKALIADRIAIRSDYQATWQCSCGVPITRSLHRKGAVSVELEVRVGERIPDIVVKRKGRIRFVIEVVVTHEPEPGALKFYKAENVAVIIVRPTWETVGALREAIDLPAPRKPRHYWEDPIHGVEVIGAPHCGSHRHPDRGPSPCPTCTKMRRAVAVSLSTGKFDCRKCSADVPVIDVRDNEPDDEDSESTVASDYPGIEVLARRLGASMGISYSRTVGRKYMAHLCPKCGVFQGDHYIYRGRKFYEGNDELRGVWALFCRTCESWEELNRWSFDETELEVGR